MTKILEPGKKTTEAAVAALENSQQIKLPADYRKFLLEYNGGRPVPDSFYFKGKTRGSSVDWFLGTDESESNSFTAYLKIYKNRIPRNFFPIASDPGDNLICISVRGSDQGSIYFWDYEGETESNGASDYSNIIPIADSFEEFLNNLHQIEI